MASLKKLGSEISTIFVVLSLPVALVLSNYHADEESRTLIFKEEVPNKALHGHVIRTEQVLNDGGCRVQCYLEPDCVSINVGPLKDGSHQCDLNGVTDDEEFAVVLTNTTGFTYNGVENLCRHGPCKNNGTCQAGFTSQGFRCICPIGILGKKCERDLRVGCFKVANNLTELGDLTGEVKWNNTNEAVKKCAKLIKNKDKGFKLFALGKGGVCLSGQDMKDKYLDSGTENAQCHNGIGIEDSMFVYSLELFSLQPVGCYKDTNQDRALPHRYLNLRGGGIQWNKTRRGLDLVVKECSEEAYKKGYEYFGVQHYGECYGNGTDYSKHGAEPNTEKCDVFDNRTGHGVGKAHTNFVYRIHKRIKKQNNTLFYW